MRVPILAADQHDLVDGPGNRLGERVLFDTARIIEKRDMRLEARIRKPSKPLARQPSAQSFAKRFELTHSVAPDQHERTAFRPAAKARGPVEGDFKWWHAHFTSRLKGCAFHV